MSKQAINVHLLRLANLNGVIVDTNLLILLLVGHHDPSFIGQKKTTKYTYEDYLLVKDIVAYASKIIVTPQILTEVANHTFDNFLTGDKYTSYFTHVLAYMNNSDESYTHKDQIAAEPLLSKFGFADVSIIEAARDLKCLVITDEGALTGLLGTLKIPSVDINQLRMNNWFPHEGK